MYVYEAYVDEAAFEAHQANEPFKQFIEELRAERFPSKPPTFVVPFTECTASNVDG